MLCNIPKVRNSENTCSKTAQESRPFIFTPAVPVCLVDANEKQGRHSYYRCQCTTHGSKEIMGTKCIVYSDIPTDLNHRPSVVESRVRTTLPYGALHGKEGITNAPFQALQMPLQMPKVFFVFTTRGLSAMCLKVGLRACLRAWWVIEYI